MIQHPALLVSVESLVQYLEFLGIPLTAQRVRQIVERHPETVIVSMSPAGKKRLTWDPATLDTLVRTATGFDIDLWAIQRKRNHLRARGAWPKKKPGPRVPGRRVGRPRQPRPAPTPPPPPLLCLGDQCWSAVQTLDAAAWMLVADGTLSGFAAPYAMRYGVLHPLVRETGQSPLVLGRRGDTPAGFLTARHGVAGKAVIEDEWPDVIWRLWTEPTAAAPTPG